MLACVAGCIDLQCWPEDCECGGVELSCPVKVVADNNVVASTLLGILIVLTATLIAVVLFINRITVREKVEPLSDLIQPLSA